MSLRSVRAAKAAEQTRFEAIEQNDGLPSWLFSRGFLIPAGLVLAMATLFISREVSSFYRAKGPALPQQVSCIMPANGQLYLPGNARLNRRDHFKRGSQTWRGYNRNTQRGYSAVKNCQPGACAPDQIKRMASAVGRYVHSRASTTIMYDQDFGMPGVRGVNRLYRTSKNFRIRAVVRDHLRKGTLKMSDFRNRSHRKLVWAWAKLKPHEFIPCRPGQEW